jgi:glycine betaine catabolism A
MNVRTSMLSQLRSRREGFSLPRAFYVDQDYYGVDMETIFYKDWVFAGHDCEINNPGQFFTLKIGDYPVVVLRDNDGGIRAFHNSCRHRGSRVCTTEHGKMRRLVCPYHQWVYNLDGSLFGARHMGEDFDKSQFGLKPVHCESFAGYIFVCVADEAPDFARFRATAMPYLAPHVLADTKVAFESTIVENGNWKLVWENNRECYHCASNHPELCRTYPEAPTATGVQGAMDDPEITAHWQRCEGAGLPSTFVMSEDGQYRTARMPLLRDAESYTMSGKRAVTKPLAPSITEPRIGTMLLFHYPSTWNHVLGDSAVTFRVLPLNALETQVTTKWLVHKDAVEGVDYNLDELTKVWIATNDQDRQIVEENQRGILSPAYQPGPYSPEHEGGVMQFVEWYANTMQRRLGGEVPALRSVA